MTKAFYTPADLERYRGQKRVILGRLMAHVTEWVTVELLEEWSRAKRVASRIDELRDDWLIKTRKNPTTKRAMYRLVGKRTEPRAQGALPDVSVQRTSGYGRYLGRCLPGAGKGVE